jgi:hypothetical protein
MTTRARRVLLGGTFVAFGLLVFFLVARLVPDAILFAALGAVATCLTGAYLAFGDPPRRETVTVAGPRPDTPAASASHPYRGAPPPGFNPRISARTTALVVCACMAFTAAAVPFAVHLPRWVEVEGVLAAWWLIWAIVLGVVARRGPRVVDDHGFVIRLPWSRAPRPPAPSKWRVGVLDVLGAASDLESILFALALVVVLGVVFLGAWLVVEVVAPALFFVAYLGVVRALRHARAYRGSTARASLAGIAWATVYVGPLAVVVWLVHIVARHG